MSDRSRLRLVVLQVLVLSLMLTLFGRLAFLQVVSGDKYQQAASDNRIREIVTPAVRGLILDDIGRPLVQNRTTLVVSIDRTTLGKQKDKGTTVLKRLSKSLKTSYGSLYYAIQLCGTPKAKKAPQCWNGSPYQPIPVAKDVDSNVALAIMERREDFPGVTAELEAVREYPTPAGANAAHVLGYLGPVTDAELAAQKDRPASAELRRTDLIGRSGLEAQYDAFLRGVPGVKSLAVNNGGAVTGTVETTDAKPGNYLVTSIDARVQAVAEAALKKQIEEARAGRTYTCGGGCKADSGAVVVMDVKTGRIVAMASYPSYDPSVWVGGITQKEYSALTSKKANTPLLSRAITGTFAPASTFKVVSTSAAVRAGESLNTTYPCVSSLKIGNTTKKNFESEAYGDISVKRAIEVSCNTVFYRLGYDAWLKDGGNDGSTAKEWFVKTAREFGYGSKTGIDLPNESAGTVISREDRVKTWNEMKPIYCARAKNGYPEVKDKSRAALLKAYAKENCTDGYRYRGGDAANFAIGQGDTLVTPLQVARVYSAIANGGTLWTPEIVKAVVSPSGKVVKTIAPKKAGTLPDSQSTIEYLQSALRGVATNGTGAGLFKDYPVQVSAKTGSGEVNGKDPTSWFASYAPSNNPQYAVVMMISQGGTGSGTSGPGVKKIYNALFGVKGNTLSPATSVLPRATLPTTLPLVRKDGTVAAASSSSTTSGTATLSLGDLQAVTEQRRQSLLSRQGSM